MRYMVSSLPANCAVEARVRTVRQAVTKGDQLFSPFTDVKHRTLQSIIQADVSEGDTEHDNILDTGRAMKTRFALTEKQIAFILFVLSVMMTVLVALAIGYWTM